MFTLYYIRYKYLILPIHPGKNAVIGVHVLSTIRQDLGSPGIFLLSSFSKIDNCSWPNGGNCINDNIIYIYVEERTTTLTTFIEKLNTCYLLIKNLL